jgi:ribonuclease III
MNLPSFNDEQLWRCALTHRSYINEHPGIQEHNERLEFLGDSILGFLVSEFLFQRYPHLSEAQLTRLRANLVDETQLARFATELGIGEYMQLGKGAQKDGGRYNPALLSDTFEAIIGAYFLDAGLAAVREFIRALFCSVADNIAIPPTQTNSQHLIDVKNRFQQWALSEYGSNPEYFLIEEFGPDHAKAFTFGVRVNGIVYGTGTGRRKQDATKAAAEAALKKVLSNEIF